MTGLLERVARTAVQEGIYDAAYSEFDSPIGRLVIVATPRGLCRVAFEEDDPHDVMDEVARVVGARIVRSDDATRRARTALAAYFEQRRPPVVPIDLGLARPGFYRDVLSRLRRVPLGRVVTYSELARRAGRPRAVRAAGTACGRNPVPIVIPCHRVVPAGGGVGKYGGGSDRKRFLLELEGAL